MKCWIKALLVAAAFWCGGAELSAQTRADSAAVILHAAQQFRLQGDHAVAQALLQYLQRWYADTPAAGEVERLRLAMRRGIRPEQSGRTELMVWGATYGAWLGIALPLMADADGPEAYGFGLLLGAPAGFFAGRAYANATNLTEGQARAITFGGTWGTYQGFAWAEVLGLGDRVAEWCTPPEERYCREAHMPTRVAAGVAGGLAGIGVGSVLARKPITAGTAAAVNSAALWGTWFGWAVGMVADLEERTLLTSTLIGGNGALLAAGLLAPGWDVSENRVRMVSVSGLVGGLIGAGIILIAQPDEQAVIVGIPLVTSALGLAAGVHYTRDMDGARTGSGGDSGPGGALIRRDNGQWALSVPEPSVRWDRSSTGARPAAYVPLLRARF
jgi:hypothetical protein